MRRERRKQSASPVVVPIVAEVEAVPVRQRANKATHHLDLLIRPLLSQVFNFDKNAKF